MTMKIDAIAGQLAGTNNITLDAPRITSLDVRRARVFAAGEEGTRSAARCSAR